MNKEEILELISKDINRCYRDFIYIKNNMKKEMAEGMRNRLDELLLLWHKIHSISFIDACKMFDINYKEISK